MNAVNIHLKEEIFSSARGFPIKREILKYHGYKRYIHPSSPIARAAAFAHLLLGHEKHIYRSDLITGSIKGIFSMKQSSSSYEDAVHFNKTVGERSFWTNYDHAAPNYAKLITLGIEGILEEIAQSLKDMGNEDGAESSQRDFLKSVQISVRAFGKFIRQYGCKAERLSKTESDDAVKERLSRIAVVCRHICQRAPQDSHEALQLVWFAHLAFVIEGRYAMALGRMDQYLYPFFQKDWQEGRMTKESARSLLENMFLKIGETSALSGADDVVNICIGGIKPDGSDVANELSSCILEAVKNCNIPGPNLSARFHRNSTDAFYTDCLHVIKTGIGYPALFNDEIIIPSLVKKGYKKEDAANYCLVGCIETFIQGKQPPWSDGRFNTSKYIELALNDGCCMITGKRLGPPTGDPLTFHTFDDFLHAFQKQIEYGAAEYVKHFNPINAALNPMDFTSPFLSALFDECIMRAADINDGGTLYPSNHGVACMGIGTVTDSLTAIYEAVYHKRYISISTLIKALQSNFKGYEGLQLMLKNKIPKYGNDVKETDRFAVWYVQFLDEVFRKYRTRDNGHFILLIAANISNIHAGHETAATPDGRNAFMPLSDAASPTYGTDRKGPTALIHSVTQPDYRLVTGGSVINQKFDPSLFQTEDSINKMSALIKTFFEKGGQEMQMNVVSRQTLMDAMNHPDQYRSLIVRVSGFSARFIDLDQEVKQDILRRTEHRG